MDNTLLIRLDRRRAVVAHIETSPGSVRLLRLSPDAGPLPDYTYLVDREFPDVAALRRAVLAAMRGPVGTTLDRVLLSREAYDQWLATVRDVPAIASIDPAKIPDEQARPISNGRLLIWVDLPNGNRVDLILPPSHWAWADSQQKNH